MWLRRLGVVLAIICFLGLNESILAKNFTIYQENFNSGASLSQLGFIGTGWELDSAGKYLRSVVPEKGPENSAQTYSAPFNANRDKGVTTVEWRVNYLTIRPGRAWSENNQTWVSLTDASGRKLYTLLFKPHCKQDQWQSFDLELSKDNGSQVIMQGWTLTETPTLAWIDFKLVLSPRSAAGGNGGIKVYANLGSGYQEFISARDESYNEFSKLHLKYQTGKGGQNFNVGIDDLRVSAEDLLPPVTSHDYRDEGKWVKTPVTVNLTASDDFSGILNTYYRINAGATQTGNQIGLAADGKYTVAYWSVDKAGNTETAKQLMVQIDQTPPVIQASISPLANAAGWHKNDLTVQFHASDSLSGIKEVTEPITISSEGAGQTVSGTAIDLAENSASTQITINLDKTAPVVAIQTPADGATLKEKRPVISGSYSDSLAGIDPTTCRITLDGNDITQSAALNVAGFSYTPASNLNTGNHSIAVTVSDRAGNEAAVVTSSFKVIPTDPNIPPDPATVAPPLDPTIVSDLKTATSFLYTGANPIQTGMDSETIVPTRAAVIRGKVLNKENEPLPGVKITILNHGEYGRTYSREDGVFDLAVNGGGYLTVKYEKEGYLSAQRQLNAPWQDYVVAEEVILTQADAVATTISLQDNTSVQIARGSLVSDEDGSRQATVIFPVGIQINGVNDANVTVRATEYTVGPNGPKAMPAELPANTAYTYCVELSVDGYDQVEFNKPVYFYVDNFLNFPVGGIVPSGYYDRNKAAWIPMDNGVIIRIAGITNGLADIDLTGSGQIADAQALTALGFTDGERQKLASMYSAGQSLWRVPLKHFSPCDLNWPIWAGFPLPGSPNAKGDQKTNKPSTSCGSIIEIQNQTLRESIGVPGTNFSINYSSDRVPGRTASNTFTATISGNVIVPELRRIRLEIKVAGRLFTGSYTPEPNKKVTFTWDGKDAYGRVVCGSQPVKIRVGYAYDTTYIAPLAEQRSFGRNAAALIAISGTSDRPDLNVWSEETINLVNTNMKEPLGGWSISAHHSYDPTQKVIYYGNGQRRSATDVSMNIQRFAGVQYGRYEDHYSGDGGQAKNAHFGYIQGMVFGSDGSMYIADSQNNCIRKVTPDGIVNTIAGCNPWGGYNGDNRLANSAWLSHPQAIAIDGEDNIYFSDFANHLIRRISKDGMLTSVAGNGISGVSPDGSQASWASIGDVKAIAVSKDGSIYFVENYSFQTRIRKIGTDGLLYTVAGTGEWRPFSPDGTQALQANIGYCIFDLAIGSDGSIYFIDAVYHRIRKIDLNGIIHTVAGTGEPSFWGDNVPALWAHLNGTNGHSLTVAQDGSIFFGDWDNAVIRYISPDGIINSLTTASGYPREYYGDNGPAKQAKVYSPSYSIKIGPDKRLYFIDYTCIRSIGSILSNFINEEIFIPSEDSSELYHFDKNGRHLETINALTGTIIYSFNYDPQGRLIQVIDGSNNITTIERDGQGNATAIIGPFGMRNILVLNSDGYLESMTNAANEITSFTYYDGGLLKTLTDPRQQTHQFFYDDLGRLTRDQDPAGGYTVLERTETQTGHQVKSIKGKDATNTYGTNYSVDYLTNGDTRMTSSGCCGGGSSVTTYGTDGSQTTTSPDGTVTTVAYGPDPWFGMQSPFVKSLSVKLPSGKTYTQTGNRSGVYTQPGTWLGLVSLTDTTTINGKTFTSVYNAAAKTVTTTSPLGRQTVTTLDAQGRVIKVEIPGLTPISFEYDPRGRLWRTTEGSGNTARISSVTYKSNGFIDYVTDPLNRQTSFEYDAIGRVTRQVLPGGRQINFSYDANGNMTKLTPPGKPEHEFGYNTVDLTDNYNPPDVGLDNDQTAFGYNLAKQPTLVSRPDGKTIGFTYDTLGRVQKILLPEGEQTYVYHATTGKLGNIIGTDDAIMSFGYDGSLPTSATWDGEIDGRVGVTYNNNFQVVTQTVNGANSVSFTYDDDGLLKTAGALTLNYDSQNGMFKDSVIGNVTDSVTYNSFGEVNHYLASYSGSSIFDVQYGERDKLGRIVTKTETVNGEAHIYTYSYDANTDRLTDVYKDGVLFSHYDYDANGNRTGYAGPNGTASGVYDDQDRMLSYGSNSYQYSANGELQSKTNGDGTTGYNYDVLGNLRTVVLPGGKQIDYVIDGANRRIGKKIHGVLQLGLLYQDSLAPVAELDGSGNVLSRFVYATGENVPDYMIKGGVTYRIVTDHLGSPRVIINVSDGSIVQRMDYDEFGKVTLDTNPGFQPFGFAGGIYDRDTGLVRFGARDYDPETGRWTAKDPIGFKAANANLYNYTGNDPINYIDPIGEKIHGVSYGASFYWWLGAQGSLAVVWDDHGNYGLLVTVGGGKGMEIGLGDKTGGGNKGKGKSNGLDAFGASYFEINDKENICELNGKSTEYSRALGFIQLDENDNPSFSLSPSIGGHISTTYSYVVPVKNYVDGMNQAWNYFNSTDPSNSFLGDYYMSHMFP